MTQCWIYAKQHTLPDGYMVSLMQDIAITGPLNWGAAISRYGKITTSIGGQPCDEAQDVYESWIFGLQYAMGLTQVLNRCRASPDPPGVWQDSSGEIASRYSKIGTWEWLDTLTLLNDQERKLKRREN
jgi:hypothetical protein